MLRLKRQSPSMPFFFSLSLSLFHPLYQLKDAFFWDTAIILLLAPSTQPFFFLSPLVCSSFLQDPCTPKQLYQAVAASLDITDAFNKQEKLRLAAADGEGGGSGEGEGKEGATAETTGLFSVYVCNDAYGR